VIAAGASWRVGWRAVGPVAAVAVAVVASLVLAGRGADQPAPPQRSVSRAPVAITSDAARVDTLEELVARSDLVVRGQVVATERGRLFGEPGAGAVQSRLVTLELAEVLAGTGTPAAALLVEEEGWLEDGTPVVVDGAAPSSVGDDGIWFLTAVGTPEAPVHVVVSAQGRYLVTGDRLGGAAGDDPLVAELARLHVDELAERIAALPSPPR
jgi:hypothetical protein